MSDGQTLGEVQIVAGLFRGMVADTIVEVAYRRIMEMSSVPRWCHYDGQVDITTQVSEYLGRCQAERLALNGLLEKAADDLFGDERASYAQLLHDSAWARFRAKPSSPTSSTWFVRLSVDLPQLLQSVPVDQRQVFADRWAHKGTDGE